MTAPKPPVHPAPAASAAGDAVQSGPDALPLADVRALAQIMKDFELGEIDLVRPSGERLRLKSRRAELPAPERAVAPAAKVAPPAAAPEPSAAAVPDKKPPDQSLVVITSPFVGTFYRSPSPDSPAFVEVGQRVHKGQTLCIIEAMKLMNELESEVDGVVVAVLADNGRPVEYGEALFHLRVG